MNLDVTQITVRLSERIDPATLVADTFNLLNLSQGSIKVPSSLSLSDGGRRVTLTPDFLLNPNQIYQGGLGGDGLYDLAGNKFSSVGTRFTTGTAASQQAPAVVASSLDGDTTAVPLNASIRVSFDQVLSEVCVTGNGILLSAGLNPVETRTILNFDSTQITLEPNDDLLPSTSYTLTIDEVCNVSGLAQSGYRLDFTSGTVVDTIRPSPIAVTPVQNSTDIPLDTVFTVEFSEALDPIWFAESVAKNGIRVYQAPNTPIPGDWVLTGDTASFTPAGLLPADQQINILFDRSSLRDRAGNVSTSAGVYFYPFFTAAL